MSSSVKFKPVKVSKNRKKSWRKFSNIDDVEEFLEDQRLDERLGGEEVAKQTFFIETSGDATCQKDVPVPEYTRPTRTRAVRRTEDILANLPCYRALKSSTAVKPCNSTKRSTKGDGVPDRLLKKAKRNLKGSVERKASKNKAGPANEFYDIWQETKDEDEKEVKELKDLQLELIGKNDPKPNQFRFKKPSLLPSIVVPHSGTSYNPSFEAHQKLLLEAHLKEVAKEKEEMHLKRVLDAYYPTAADMPLEERWLSEMSEGLARKGEEETSENEASTMEVIPKITKRKLKAQRRREQAQRVQMKAAQEKKEERIRENQVFLINKFKKTIKEQDKKSESRQKKKRDKEAAKMYNPKRLSRHKFEEPDPDLNLGNEITGTLRNVKTQGDLLKDVYVSLQRRNIIETRVAILKKRKKAATKLYVKNSHRD